MFPIVLCSKYHLEVGFENLTLSRLARKIICVATALSNTPFNLAEETTVLVGAFDTTFFSFDTTSFGEVPTITVLSKLRFGEISMC